MDDIKNMKSKNNVITNFYEGGEIFFKQATIISNVTSVLLFIFFSVTWFSLYKSCKDLPTYHFQNVGEMMETYFLNVQDKDIPIIMHHTPFGNQRKSINFILNSKTVANSIKKIKEESVYAVYRGGAASFGVLIIMAILFIAEGKRQSKRRVYSMNDGS